MTGPGPHIPVGADTGPDPSSLTTAALAREIAHLRELLESRIDGLRDFTMSQVTDLHRQLAEADTRYQQRYDSQTKALDAARVAADLAVQAALVAAEKAVSKAEVAAEKRFDTVNDKVDDLKTATNGSLAAIQSQLAVSAGRGAGLNAGWGYLVAVIGIIVIIVNVAIYLATK